MGVAVYRLHERLRGTRTGPSSNDLNNSTLHMSHHCTHELPLFSTLVPRSSPTQEHYYATMTPTHSTFPLHFSAPYRTKKFHAPQSETTSPTHELTCPKPSIPRPSSAIYGGYAKRRRSQMASITAEKLSKSPTASHAVPEDAEAA